MQLPFNTIASTHQYPLNNFKRFSQKYFVSAGRCWTDWSGPGQDAGDGNQGGPGPTPTPPTCCQVVNRIWTYTPDPPTCSQVVNSGPGPILRTHLPAAR